MVLVLDLVLARIHLMFFPSLESTKLYYKNLHEESTSIFPSDPPFLILILCVNGDPVHFSEQ